MTAVKRVNGSSGFTLIEVIIVMVLTSILGIFTFQYLTGSMRTFKTFTTRKERCDDARMALDRISREIRDAQLSTVSITAPDTITFTRENVSNMQDTSPSVSFLLDSASGELRRQSAAGTSVLARNVQDFTASSGAGGTISLSITFSSSSGTIQWQTVVYPRNS